MPNYSSVRKDKLTQQNLITIYSFRTTEMYRQSNLPTIKFISILNKA